MKVTSGLSGVLDQTYLGELVAHDGVLLGEVHDAEGELESGVGLGDDRNEYQ